MFFLDKRCTMDKIAFCHFMYVLKKNVIFTKKKNNEGIFVKNMLNLNEGLDFGILVFQRSFNKIF